MNGDRFSGIYKQLGGLVKAQWGAFIPAARAQAREEQIHPFGSLQERLGMRQQEADAQLAEFLARNRNWQDI